LGPTRGHRASTAGQQAKQGCRSASRGGLQLKQRQQHLNGQEG